MSTTDVLVPGARDVRGTLEEPDGAVDAIVVACPPHPRHGGTRSDRRLAAVAAALVDRDVACLRFDYGDWDEGYGEREDVRNAIRWAAGRDRYDRVGVFGYSFGATLSIVASATVDADVDALAALAPTARLAEGLDAVDALEDLPCSTAVLYGARDTTVEWEPVVERARELGGGFETVELPGDHFFVGQHGRIADRIGSFFEDHLR